MFRLSWPRAGSCPRKLMLRGDEGRPQAIAMSSRRAAPPRSNIWARGGVGEAENIILLIEVTSIDTQRVRLQAEQRETSGPIQRPGSEIGGVDSELELTHARK